MLDPITLKEKRSLPLAFGRAGIAGQALQLPDGGYLLFGQFDVWYDGRRYRSILRTHADGTPDASWRVETNGSLVRATITSRGVVLEGAFSSVNGVANNNGIALVSLAPGAAVEPGWGAEWINFSYNTPFDGQAYFYTVAFDKASSAIRRVALANGRFDPAWSIPLAPVANDEHVISLAYDAAGGIWVFSGVDFFELNKTTTIQRFDIASKQETLRMAAGPSQSYTRTLVSDTQFAYIGSQRYTLARGGEPDSTWNLARSYVGFESALHAITPKYLYFADKANDDTSAILLRRALLSGNGAADPDWLMRPRATTSGFVAQVLSLIVQTASPGSDDIEYLMAQHDDRYDYSNSAIATSRNAPVADKTVVEYFNRDASRYFMSGRTDEKALLDAMPGSFLRTGMTFAAKSSIYSDVPEAPICRFYSAPENGGSNTHFYGTGDDCAVLNTVSQLRFEGFDFAVTRPTGAVCPAAAPNPVYRLFNNKSATNEGNHRYVVSTATKSRMIAQGWVDEGAVFCSASVTDAVN